MEIKSAEFVASYPRERDCPTDGRSEIAFIGRSNVGKSSLINMLAGKKGLAKVSQTPGKTRLLNFFLINNGWYLVDLPGYGYARVSKTEQKNLSQMIDGYLLHREKLLLAFVLIDSTLEPKKIDLDFVNALGEAAVPFALVFTKSDKKGSIRSNVQKFLDAMAESWETLPAHFITSAERRTGREEVLEYIGKILKRRSQ